MNAEGGVDVTLTSDVLPGDGSTALSIGVGTSHITGAQAEQLAVAIGAEEPEASRLARQQILVEAILAKLPRTAAQIVLLLQPAQISGGLTPVRLAALLANVRQAVTADQAASTVVPNTEIDSGSGTPSYGLDDSGTATMVSTRLAGAMLPTPAGGRARILVQNGVGTPGLGDDARAVLVAKGYAFRSGGNASAFSSGPVRGPRARQQPAEPGRRNGHRAAARAAGRRGRAGQQPDDHRRRQGDPRLRLPAAGGRDAVRG